VEYRIPTDPFGSEVVVTFKVAAAMVKVRFTVALCTGDPESTILNVTARPVTGAVGVPLTTPVDEFSESPLGSVPEVMLQVNVAVPPVAVSVFE
jgi:hypothetical protein